MKKTCKDNFSRCPECNKEFIKQREWQKTCKRLECLIRYKRKLCQRWRSKNSEKNKEYQKVYRDLYLRPIKKNNVILSK